MTLAESNHMPFPAKLALDLGVSCYISLFGLHAAEEPSIVNNWTTLSSSIGWALAVAGLIYGAGRIVAQLQQSGKTDAERIKTLEETVRRQEKICDRAISDSARLERLEGAVRRIDRKFYALVGSLTPLLKEFDVDTRSGGNLGRVLAQIEEDDSTVEG